MHLRLRNIIAAAVVACVAGSCFTGVESTKTIDDKEVRRALQEMSHDRPAATIAVEAEPVAQWQPGKQFWVIDSAASVIFLPGEGLNPDSLRLAGTVITYAGTRERRQFDNRRLLDLCFVSHADTLYYSTGKTIEEIDQVSPTIPFLVDGDIIAEYSRQLVGKTLYVKTPIWYDLQGNMTTGKKFVPVVVNAVEAGNKVFPLRVIFSPADDRSREAMLWLTLDNSTIAHRDFGALFSMTDVRLNYPNVTAATWQRIVDGTVAEGMTKEECRLSLGAPRNVRQLPDQTGLREYWYYDGGRYLFFVDGLLKEYR